MLDLFEQKKKCMKNSFNLTYFECFCACEKARDCVEHVTCICIPRETETYDVPTRVNKGTSPFACVNDGI
jgi:hypothetical protein